MNASPFFGTLHRLRSRLRLLFGRHTTGRAALRARPSVALPVARSLVSKPPARPMVMDAAPALARVALEAPTAPVVVAPTPVPAPAAMPVAMPAPVVAAVAEAQAPAKTMRSLEEVRADLARLRESARERHAKATVAVRRDISFAPTDFMDFAKPEPVAAAQERFEQTAFLDFTTLTPRR